MCEFPSLDTLPEELHVSVSKLREVDSISRLKMRHDRMLLVLKVVRLALQRSANPIFKKLGDSAEKLIREAEHDA